MTAVRRRAAWPGTLVALGLLALVTLAAGIPYAIAGTAAKRPQIQTVPTRLVLPGGKSIEDLQEVKVYEAAEPDSVDVVIGDRVERVRYIGATAPTAGERCYREALDRNTTLTGGHVLLLEGPQNMDDNGRLLRYVFTRDGISIDGTLVAEGFARVSASPGPLADQLQALESQARDESRGCLWK
jgi:endonuclease YncB( thermonuclease family)